MEKEEWMKIWEEIFKKNKEEIENTPTLSKEEFKMVVNSLGMAINLLKEHNGN